jgi:succinate dehydrogenase / fumarate reductase cytochrome b subunit
MVYVPDRGPASVPANSIPRQLGGSYRWFTGSLAYVLHRVTGIGLFVFLVFHIISITKANASPAEYDLMIRRMQEADFKLGELALFGALLFHGLNGLRILHVDFAGVTTRSHKVLFWAMGALTVGLLVVGAIPLVLHWNVQPIFADTLPGATYGAR